MVSVDSQGPAPPPPGPSYTCTECRGKFHKSYLKILDEARPEGDWQGEIPANCKECFENGPLMDKRRRLGEWRRMCNRFWDNRQEAHQNTLRNTNRCKNWATVVETVGEKIPGESRAEYRVRLLGAMKSMADSFAAVLNEESDRKLAQRSAALEDWCEELKKKADDPTYVTKLEHPILSHHAVQYASQLWKGCDNFFICRHRACLTVARNIDWVVRESGGVYACPVCGERYHPHKKQPGCVMANKVMVAPASLAGQIGSVGKVRQREVKLAEDGQRYVILPMLWLDTTEQQLCDQMMRICLEIDDELDGLESYQSKVDYVVDKVRAASTPALMRFFEFSVPQQQRIDAKNSQEKIKWKYDHLVEHGYTCMQLESAADSGPTTGAWQSMVERLSVPDLDEPMTQEQGIYLSAYLRWLAATHCRTSAHFAPGPPPLPGSPTMGAGRAGSSQLN